MSDKYIIIFAVLLLVIYKIWKSPLEFKRSILRTFNLDFTKEKCRQIKLKEIKKELLPILNEAYCGASLRTQAMPWNIAEGHIIRKMEEELLYNMDTPVTIKYKMIDGNCEPYLDHFGIMDTSAYYYALAMEIVKRHLSAFDYLPSDFEEPFEEISQYKNIDKEEWKIKSKIYKFYYEHHWKFVQKGNWLCDKEFRYAYINGLIDNYIDPIPIWFLPK